MISTTPLSIYYPALRSKAICSPILHGQTPAFTTEPPNRTSISRPSSKLLPSDFLLSPTKPTPSFFRAGMLPRQHTSATPVSSRTATTGSIPRLSQNLGKNTSLPNNRVLTRLSYSVFPGSQLVLDGCKYCRCRISRQARGLGSLIDAISTCIIGKSPVRCQHSSGWFAVESSSASAQQARRGGLHPDTDIAALCGV